MRHSSLEKRKRRGGRNVLMLWPPDPNQQNSVSRCSVPKRGGRSVHNLSASSRHFTRALYARLYANPIFRGERAEGIEPSCVAWKATVLPLNYARVTDVSRRCCPSRAEKCNSEVRAVTRQRREGAGVAADLEAVAAAGAAHGDGRAEGGGEIAPR